MSTQGWTTPAAAVTALSTELDALANNTGAISSEIDFTAIDRPLYMGLEVYLATPLNLVGQSSSSVYIWLLKTMNISYEEGGAALAPMRQPDAIVPLHEASGAVLHVVPLIPTSPIKGKLLVWNNAGVTLASTGNIIKYRTYTEQSV